MVYDVSASIVRCVHINKKTRGCDFEVMSPFTMYENTKTFDS